MLLINHCAVFLLLRKNFPEKCSNEVCINTVCKLNRMREETVYAFLFSTALKNVLTLFDEPIDVTRFHRQSYVYKYLYNDIGVFPSLCLITHQNLYILRLRFGTITMNLVLRLSILWHSVVFNTKSFTSLNKNFNK